MTQTTIRVDEAVHEELERRKHDRAAESYNELLRHVLGLVPAPDDVADLTAYYAPDLRDAAVRVIDSVREIAPFDERVEDEGHFRLVLSAPDSGRDVAAVCFEPDGVVVRYRDEDYDWDVAATVGGTDRGEDLAYDAADGGTDRWAVSNAVESRISGALERWG